MKLLDYMLIEWEKEREKREEEAISKKSNWRVSKKHTRALIWHEKVDELNQYLRLRLWENSIQKFFVLRGEGGVWWNVFYNTIIHHGEDPFWKSLKYSHIKMNWL